MHNANNARNGAQWRERFFESTRGKVVLLLRTGEQTVNELADDLELTDNAVRAHLTSLERDGLIERSGSRPGSGKPSYTYRLTGQAESLFPKAYALVLSQLLATAEDQLDDPEHERLLRATGERLASAAAVPPGLSLVERAEFAADLLTKIGGLAEVQQENSHLVIAGASCPMPDVARERDDICQLAGWLVEEITGSQVDVCCQRGDQPRCRFSIHS